MAEHMQKSAAPIFEFESYVSFSEVDHRSTLTLPALINYYQDASTFQSEAIGMGMAWLKERQRGWVLTHWQIVVDRYPALYEHIRIGTFASAFKGVTATRYFYLRGLDDELLARAKSTWAYMDLAKGRPTRPDPQQMAAYGTAEPLAMPDEERHVRMPDESSPCDSFTVRRGHIDPNEHVNNGQYVQMALEVLPRELNPRVVRVDYRRAAVLGNVICPAVAREPERTVVALNDTDGSPYSMIEFSETPAED